MAEAMIKHHPKRQTTRRILIFISLLLFPVTLNYFSPYVIIDGAMQGIINGSFIIFGAMFVASLFVGRLWCGWLCPAAGLGEACFLIRDKPARGGKLQYIVVVEGLLTAEHWQAWFEGVALSAVDGGNTQLLGDFDQPALHGLLARIRDLGLVVVAVRRLPIADDDGPSGTSS